MTRLYKIVFIIVLVTGFCMLGVTNTHAQTKVKLDISSGFNYDGFGTENELTYADTQTGVPHRLYDILGDHNIKNDANTTTFFAGTDGVSVDGLLDVFELGRGLSRKWDSVDGQTKVNNCFMWAPPGANGFHTGVVEIVLSGVDQKKYADLNFLVSGNRNADLNITYSAEVEVKYVGDPAWHSVWLSVHNPGDTDLNLGTFGWKWDSVGGEAAIWTAVDVETASANTKGIEGWQTDTDGFKHSLLTARSQYGYMYKFTTALALDDSKVLEKIKMSSITSTAWRGNWFLLYAATATEAPSAKGFEIRAW